MAIAERDLLQVASASPNFVFNQSLARTASAHPAAPERKFEQHQQQNINVIPIQFGRMVATSGAGAGIVTIVFRDGQAPLCSDDLRQEIAALYTVSDSTSIFEFLSNHDGLEPFLIEAASKLCAIFCTNSLLLDLLIDPEEANSGRLLVRVGFTGEALEAFELLETFETTWWAAQRAEVGDLIAIDVRFDD